MVVQLDKLVVHEVLEQVNAAVRVVSADEVGLAEHLEAVDERHDQYEHRGRCEQRQGDLTEQRHRPRTVHPRGFVVFPPDA